MKKEYIRGLIWFLGFAIFGLIVLQVIWLTGSYRRESENYRKLIVSAVNQAHERILSSTRPKLGIRMESSGLPSGSKANPGSNLAISHQGAAVVKLSKPKGDSVNFIRSETIPSDMPLRLVDSVFKRVLSEMDLKATYELTAGTPVKDPSLNAGVLQGKAKSLQFTLTVPDKVSIKSSRDVLIRFDQEVGSIIKRMGWVVGLNVILMLLIALAFIYSLTIILRQKKIYQMRKDFIDNLTHDFKTPVSNISLALEGLIQFGFLKNPDKSLEYMKIAQMENQRLGLMIEKTLNLAIFEKGKIRLKKSEVDVHDMIRETVRIFKVQISHRNGIVSTDLLADRFLAMGDRDHLVQVVFNLLDNANKYSPVAPQIEIRTRNSAKTGFLEVFISDQGTGIPLHLLERIFEPYVRNDEIRERDIKGFGLGLAYSKQIMLLHDGDISVSSDPGVGSTFKLSLPLV